MLGIYDITFDKKNLTVLYYPCKKLCHGYLKSITREHVIKMS